METGPLIGAIDEGTSSARFILFRAGTSDVIASHQHTLAKIYPQEGWVEQDPLEILNVVMICIEKTIEKLISIGGNVKDIIAIGVTNQRESTIVWRKSTGEPLYNSIVWLDVRTSTTVDQLLDKIPNKARNKDYLKHLCGLPLSPYFSAVKLRWLIDNVQNVKKAVIDNDCLFGTVDTWLIWNLTGGINGGIHITDVSNASRTMLMNIDTLKWDNFLLNFFDVPKTVLPDIRSSSEVYGTIATSSLIGIQISGCLGDQQSALVGQQCLQMGEAKVTYGTGCFLLYNTGTEKIDSKHGLLTTVAYQLGRNSAPVYAVEGSVAIAGAALIWLKDNMNLLSNFEDAQMIAEKANMEAGEVYFVPAFSGLYAPYWQQEARGVIVGISLNTESSHIVKATLDAVCYQTRDILESMNKDCRYRLSTIQVDGGMTTNSLLMQLQADLSGLTIIKPLMAESTALGAAMVAGSAIGQWDLNTQMELPCQLWSPRLTDDERDMKYSKWKFAVEKAMDWNVAMPRKWQMANDYEYV